MRKLYLLLPLLAVAVLLTTVFTPEPSTPKLPRVSKEQRIDGAIEHMLFTSRDIDKGYIPYDKLFKAIEHGEKQIALSQHSRNRNGSLTQAIWRTRGPNNVGGRTRAIMIDESDPTRNRIWVGSVSGGIWRTENISLSDPKWEKLTLQIDNLAIGSIAQDPNNHQVIYVGTGEGFPNIDAVTGAGIFKSTDDGQTWEWLASTRNGSFQNVHEVFVHPSGDVYAGTQNSGVWRSKDGGGSWERVLGNGLSGATNDNFFDFQYVESTGTFFASNASSLFKSPTGNRGDWVNIGTTNPGFPTNLVRVEFAVCPTNPNVMYVLGSVNGSASNTFVSNNGGESWISRPAPGIFPGQDFTNGQAWYDLDIAVDPFNCGRIIAGGVPLYESFQGLSWSPVDAGGIHVDQHNITFDPKKQGRILFGNDGGIWMTDNGGSSIFDKNFGYVTTQFYAGAIHPDKGSPYILGGTQDNNSLQISATGLAPARSVWGGDGMFCHIDQNEPNIQMVSSQFGNYGLSTNGGQNFGFGASVNGGFINVSGYDDDANILYGQTNENAKDYFRWNVNTGTVDFVDVAARNFNVSAVRIDPNTPNRVYFGTGTGQIIRVDNAHTGDIVQGTMLRDFPTNAAISSIHIDKFNPDHILVSLYNFGAGLQNIWISYDGGNEWISIEGDLPDMPVRWALFDPANHDRAMIATEAGVWVTDEINGSQTHWEPIPPSNGMPFVKVDMLLIRDSDKVVLAATHGRGMFTTDVFSAPAPVIISQPIAYVGQPVMIDGSQSVNAQDFEWNLGDNTMSDATIITHVYDEPGTYTISLTINGNITDTKTIHVLPYLPAPYVPGVADYAGDFDVNPTHFAAFTHQGTGFQRGSSVHPGKDGTNSGTAAWVLGLNDPLYQNNSRAELYTPMYDLSEPGLYELKFFSKYAVQNRNDGFQVEYSVDGGNVWVQLGSRDNPNWYNYLNLNIADGAFPIGKAYFTNAQLNWTQYIKDISFLGGESTVSFRFVFRSDGEERAQGLAIDDFEISRYEGELKTRITVFNANYTGEQEVTVNWTTGIEYQCQRFLLERSYTGFGFEQVALIPAVGIVSSFANNYIRKDQSLRNVIYYRLKVINENPEIDYFFEFYSDTIVVRRDTEADIVHQVLPNPFTDQIGISFSSIIQQPIHLRLFDISGKLVREDITTPHAAFYRMDRLRLPAGVYVLSVQIGNGELKSYKLYSSGS